MSDNPTGMPRPYRWIEEIPRTLGFAHVTLDRFAEKRNDEAFLEDARSDPLTRTFVFAGDVPVIRRGSLPLDPLYRFADVPFATEIGEPIFLGLDEGHPRFCVTLPASILPLIAEQADIKAIDLRSIAVQGLVTTPHMNMLATAKALTAWHMSHGFCARCGAPSRIICAGWKRHCDACGTEHFPRTDPVVIMMAVRGDECLLGRSPRFPPGMYSCLAGFMEPGESIEDAVRREIFEETGVASGPVAYHFAQPWPFPMSLMIGCMAEARSETITLDGNELEDARWFSRAEIVRMLAGEHPDGITAPTTMSIASHLMKSFIES